MEKVLLIDGNSIMNRAFYGIMGNKMLQNIQMLSMAFYQ